MESLVGRTKVRLLLILGLGSLSLLGLFVYSLTVGSVPIGWTDALDAFVKAVMSGGEVISVQEKIVYLVRFPRFLAAVGVGVGLAKKARTRDCTCSELPPPAASIPAPKVVTSKAPSPIPITNIRHIAQPPIAYCASLRSRP